MDSVIYIVMHSYEDTETAIPVKAFRTKEEANEFINLVRLDNNRKNQQGEHCSECPIVKNEDLTFDGCNNCISNAKKYCNFDSPKMKIDKYDDGEVQTCFVDCSQFQTVYNNDMYYISECDFVEM